MTRGVRWYLVGSLVLVALAGCSRSWIGQREPWRREAEEQCLKSGAVKEGPAVSILKPIEGPGVCGAEFPLKVAALGEGGLLGYADEVRPPGAIPQAGNPRPPASAPLSRVESYLRAAPAPPRYDNPRYPSGRLGPPRGETPLSLSPPGVEPPPADLPGAYAPPMPDYGSPPESYRPYRGRESYPAQGYPAARRGNPEPAPSDPMFTPAPLERQSPYPPRYPANGERVPVGPARAPQTTGSVTPAAVSPPATLACPVVSALDRWVSEAVQPAAKRWFGQPVAEIKQISAYSCRGMNGNSRAHISEHAFGNALDISAFVLADGYVVTVKAGWRGAPEEQGFLRDVQAAACEQFTTVLAPGSNVYHYDHIHVDLMRRASGRSICQPAAVPGDVVAARARQRGGYAARRVGDTSVTGSITPRRSVSRNRRLPDAPFEEDLNLPKAVAGDD